MEVKEKLSFIPKRYLGIILRALSVTNLKRNKLYYKKSN